MKMSYLFGTVSLITASVATAASAGATNPGNLADAAPLVAGSESLTAARSFTWSQHLYGKSFSETDVVVSIKSDDALTVTSTRRYSSYNVGGGLIIVTVDTEKKVATISTSQDGPGGSTPAITNTYVVSSGDAGVQGYQDLIKRVISELKAEDGNAKSAELIAQRDEAVRLLSSALTSAQ